MLANNLKNLRDEVLLSEIKRFVQSERDAVVKVLHHLREIERRRLYCDRGYRSLFDYAVRELKYSEGQASRRIQAMRLITDLPEVEAKIADGALSLTNVQQAQSLFREIRKSDPKRIVGNEEKLTVLAKIENKSTREAQRELVTLQPEFAIPKERERVLTETVSELRIAMSDSLKAKLEEVRSHLGPKGATMSYAELFAAMADVTLTALQEKRFGKKRTQSVPAPSAKQSLHKKSAKTPAPKVKTSTNKRYIPRAVKHLVWVRDKGQCVACGSKRNLNFDHVVPVSLGGASVPDNLRLLCFGCNQRASTKIFGRIYERPIHSE